MQVTTSQCILVRPKIPLLLLSSFTRWRVGPRRQLLLQPLDRPLAADQWQAQDEPVSAQAQGGELSWLVDPDGHGRRWGR